MIAYRSGAGTRQFKWFDRAGRQVGALGGRDGAQPVGVQLSADDRSVMFRRTLRGNTDLWLIESARNILRPLTRDPARDYEGVWSPGGDRIVFTSDRNGILNLYTKSVSDSTASAETLLLDTSEHKNISSWSEDGKFVLYSAQSAASGADLWALPLFGDRKPMLVAQSPAAEQRGRFSPDSRWLAYESNESGRPEIFVQSFPDAARKVQISVGGGTEPVWRRDGREIFFRSAEDHLMAASITLREAQIVAGKPSVLFVMPDTPSRARGSASAYAAARDGQRFIINTIVEGASPVTILLNWKPRD
jgi:Tol biopolymer transport system component